MVYKMYPTSPDWNLGSDRFDECYEQVVSLEYSLREEQPRKKSISTPNERVCALCGLDETKATFSNISHIPPMCIGNRIYVSNEECDTCNSKYGDTHDRELGHMLAGDRAVFGIRSRKGTFTIPGKKGRSQVVGSWTGQLNVSIDETDDSITWQELGESTAILSMVTPSFKPVWALKSILRSFWLSCNKDVRKKFEFIRQFILGHIEIAPTTFYKHHLDSSRDSVSLDAWVRCETCDLPTSELLIRLTLSHTCIMWCAPNRLTLKHSPSLFPPFEQPNIVRTISVHQINCPTVDTVISEPRVSFTMSRGSVPGRSQVLNSSNKKPKRKSFDANVVLKSESGEIDIKTNFTLYRNDHHAVRFKLEGNGLAGSIVYHYERNDKIMKYEQQFQLHGYSAKAAMETVKFFRFAYEEGAIMTITVPEKGLRIPDMPIYRDENLPEFYPGVYQFLECLLFLNEKLQIDFRYPETEEPPPLAAAERLAKIMESGFLEFDEQKFDFTMDVEAAKKLLQMNHPIEKYGAKVSSLQRGFLGQKVELGPVTILLRDVSFEKPQTELLSEVEGLAEDSSVSLSVFSKSSVLLFDRWYVEPEDAMKEDSAGNAIDQTLQQVGE